MRVGNHTIRDTHSYGQQCNWCNYQVIKRWCGEDGFIFALFNSSDIFKRIGFGQRSAVKFPGESTGLILPPSKWNVSEVATICLMVAVLMPLYYKWYRPMPCWQIMV